MWGDQWICVCGTHNFFIRKKCRTCGRAEEEGKVKEEGWAEVMEGVIEVNKHGEKENN